MMSLSIFKRSECDYSMIDRAGLPEERRVALGRLRELLVIIIIELVIVELGAGSAVPTVRRFSERVARHHEATLVRINPREPEGPHGTIGIALGAAAALDALVS